LRQLVALVIDENRTPQERVLAGTNLLARLQALRDKDATPAELVLAELRESLLKTSRTTSESWVRAAVNPAIVELDRNLLAALQPLGEGLADKEQTIERRIQSAYKLSRLLEQLRESLRPTEMEPVLLGSASVPRAGLPVNLALAGLAEKGYLDGPLSPPRQLRLQNLHRVLRPVFDVEDSKPLQEAVARVLSEIHLSLHAIYKPDDNAEGRAQMIARRNNPAADHASHSIIIYELK
jgi:hypothetical protein